MCVCGGVGGGEGDGEENPLMCLQVLMFSLDCKFILVSSSLAYLYGILVCSWGCWGGEQHDFNDCLLSTGHPPHSHAGITSKSRMREYIMGVG